MENIIAHIDEFGTNSLAIDKDGVSSHFLLCATLISSSQIEEANTILTNVRNQYFQGSEIKSSKIKRAHHNRRITILNALTQIEFSIYVIVVDKSEINSKGLSIKKSFYKFFNKVLVQELLKINRKITFVADQIGTQEYQNSVKEYIDNQLTQYDLFDQNGMFEFSDSQNSNIIQLSDFLAGTLAKNFDSKHFQINSNEYLNLLKDKLHVKYWPNNVRNYLRTNDSVESYNPIIAELSANLANDYIIRNEHKNEDDIKSQVYVLRYLLLIQKISPAYFAQTNDLINKLSVDLHINYQVRIFRKNIIGNLRDSNIIIVSSNSGGYKLPVNNADIIEFVNKYNGILMPMLSRMKKCRDLIQTRSRMDGNAIDILNYPEYQSLKDTIDAIS